MEPFRTESAGGSSSESLPPTPASGLPGQVCFCGAALSEAVLHAIHSFGQFADDCACHRGCGACTRACTTDAHLSTLAAVEPQSGGAPFPSTPAVVSAPGTPLTPDERSELDHLRWLVSCDRVHSATQCPCKAVMNVAIESISGGSCMERQAHHSLTLPWPTCGKPWVQL